MKKLRIGFSALVALVAIGLTIAAQAGVFENKIALTVAAESDCFDVQTASGQSIEVKDQDDCSASKITLNETIECVDNTLDGYKIFTDLSTLNPVALPELECGGEDQVCCIEVARDQTARCTTPELQPQFNIGGGQAFTYVVANVRCKP